MAISGCVAASSQRQIFGGGSKLIVSAGQKIRDQEILLYCNFCCDFMSFNLN